MLPFTCSVPERRRSCRKHRGHKRSHQRRTGAFLLFIHLFCKSAVDLLRVMITAAEATSNTHSFRLD